MASRRVSLLNVAIVSRLRTRPHRHQPKDGIPLGPHAAGSPPLRGGSPTTTAVHQQPQRLASPRRRPTEWGPRNPITPPTPMSRPHHPTTAPRMSSRSSPAPRTVDESAQLRALGGPPPAHMPILIQRG
ncbi:hypothetical protein K523DRAFT_321305 [Schizophyllum commune Tattone D]|nr:hypothetical protein K523DRAFT_321305 [Schizophyllum commune Tattone D]